MRSQRAREAGLVAICQKQQRLLAVVGSAWAAPREQTRLLCVCLPLLRRKPWRQVLRREVQCRWAATLPLASAQRTAWVVVEEVWKAVGASLWRRNNGRGHLRGRASQRLSMLHPPRQTRHRRRHDPRLRRAASTIVEEASVKIVGGRASASTSVDEVIVRSVGARRSVSTSAYGAGAQIVGAAAARPHCANTNASRAGVRNVVDRVSACTCASKASAKTAVERVCASTIAFGADAKTVVVPASARTSVRGATARNAVAPKSASTIV